MAKEISWIECIALILMTIGALNWGLLGTLDIDLVDYFLSNKSIGGRIVYITIGLSGLYFTLVKIAEFFNYK